MVSSYPGIKKTDRFVFGRMSDEVPLMKWDMDWKSRHVWKAGLFYRRYNQVDLDNNADVKFPREISRFHTAVLWGIDHVCNGNRESFTWFREELESWLQSNPYLRSINWACTQDVAIRAVNLLWAESLFLEALKNEPALHGKLVKSLYLHGTYIYSHPEYNSYNNHNHYLSNLVGLIFLGIRFKDTKRGSEWLDWGKEELFREIRYQFLPSGPSYERSVNYHRFVVEMSLYAILLLDNNNYEIPADIRYRLEKMLEFILYYTKPDGTAPIIGDQDDARLVVFSPISNLDHRYLLAIGAVLFDNGQFKAAAGSSELEISLVLGHKYLERFEAVSPSNLPLCSKGFNDAGFFIIRNNNDYMFINNSGKSKNAELGGGTHTHSDLLSFELYIEDKTFIVDPGTYVYSSNPEQRMRFRSTAMHNTIVVDKQSQNTLRQDSLWDFQSDAIPKTMMWKEDDKTVQYEGEHDGYRKLNHPIVHRRKIEYDKNDRSWIITDKLMGSGVHYVELYLHFDIGIDIRYSDNLLSTQCDKGTNIDIHFRAEKGLQGTILDGWVSKSYSSRERAKVFCLHGEVECPMQIITLIHRRSE
ncbi:MAG: alginate lyase family protein [Candidatus Cloacimonetes bacterium]|nr:alginate lyase family protein [Candidatus Cloacimonadota bacterium]